MKIKICCIQSIAEAEMAIAAGAHAIGLVGKMPSGPGPIEDDNIAQIASWAPPSVETFLLTSETTAEGIIAHHRHAGTSAIQLVDAVPANTYKILRSALRGVKLIQVIHVTGEASIDEAREAAPHVDMLLLDSGNPNAEIKELGGTGRQHDWSVSARLVKAVSIPVFLAGGLHAGNVREAIQTVRPYGVDICSGIRTEHVVLEASKLHAFMHAVRSVQDIGLR